MSIKIGKTQINIEGSGLLPVWVSLELRLASA
jgi:hypothetical protein